MPRLKFRRQQTKRRDYWKACPERSRRIDILLHRHELRLAQRIYFLNRRVIAWIHFDEVRIFVNNLRLVVAHSVDLVRDLLVVFTWNDDANQFLTANAHSVPLNRLRRASLIRKRIE